MWLFLAFLVILSWLGLAALLVLLLREVEARVRLAREVEDGRRLIDRCCEIIAFEERVGGAPEPAEVARDGH